MADTVNVAGKHVNKWVVYGGIGVVVVVTVLYFKKKNAAGSSSSTGAQQANAIDPVTGLPVAEDNQIDPATGLTYLAEAQQYGSVSAAESSVGAGYGGVSSAGTGYSGLGYGYPTYSPTETGQAGAYATNSAWAQAVQAGLPGITGDSASNVATAIGNYLAGLALTSTQANDIQVAIAEYGPPPSGNLQIIQASSSSGATSTGSSTSTGSGASTGTSGGVTQAQAQAQLASLAWGNPITDPATMIALGINPALANQPGARIEQSLTGPTYQYPGASASLTVPQALAWQPGQPFIAGARQTNVFTMPNVVGKTYDQAKSAVLAAGYPWGQYLQGGSQVVTSQAVPAGQLTTADQTPSTLYT